jgi:hypothetical protein
MTIIDALRSLVRNHSAQLLTNRLNAVKSPSNRLRKTTRGLRQMIATRRRFPTIVLKEQYEHLKTKGANEPKCQWRAD